MKRSAPHPRNKTEQRSDSNRHYGAYIQSAKKMPSKINPIFLEKPHYGLEGVKK